MKTYINLSALIDTFNMFFNRWQR